MSLSLYKTWFDKSSVGCLFYFYFLYEHNYIIYRISEVAVIDAQGQHNVKMRLMAQSMKALCCKIVGLR